jgi:hypothetical protein
MLSIRGRKTVWRPLSHAQLFFEACLELCVSSRHGQCMRMPRSFSPTPGIGLSICTPVRTMLGLPFEQFFKAAGWVLEAECRFREVSGYAALPGSSRPCAYDAAIDLGRKLDHR